MKIKKRLAIAIHILIGILAIATVPASVFFMQIPEYTTIMLCVLFIITFILCLKLTVKKLGGRIVLTVFSFIIMAISVLGNYCNPYWNSLNFKGYDSAYSQPIDTLLTAEEATEDVEYAMQYLKKLHPAFYSEVPIEVQQRYEAVLAEIDNMESISVCELSQKIESIFSAINDGHTYVKSLTEDTHYMKDINQFKQNHDTLVAVNGIELADLLKQTEELYSYEVESWHLRCLKRDLITSEGLQYLGFSTEDGVTYTYESEEGIRKDATYYTLDFLLYDEYLQYNHIDNTQEEQSSFVYYEIDKENDIAILTLNSCEYNEEYRDCLNHLFTEIKAKGIDNIAVDLRSNGGGNSLVADEFIRYLDVDTWKDVKNEWRFGLFMIPSGSNEVTNDKYADLTFTGNVYILTSASSFSSAMLFAEYCKDNNLGTIIGEAPGNIPNGYGDIAIFTLPNSRLFMQISTKEFYRIDQENERNLIDPDIPCKSDDAINVLYETVTGK